MPQERLQTDSPPMPKRPATETLFSLASQIERARRDLQHIAIDASDVANSTKDPHIRKLAEGLRSLALQLLNIEAIASLSQPPAPPPMLPSHMNIPPRLAWRDRWRLVWRGLRGR